VTDVAEIAFQTPSVSDGGVVTIDVTFDGVDWIKLPVELPNDNFLYYHTEFGSISPTLGSDSGGTLVQIYGHGFPDTGNIAVRFGSAVVQAEWRNEGVLELTSPPLAVGTHSLAITFNGGVDWKNLGGHEWYVFAHMDESELGLSPVAGPMEGNTAVTMTLLDGPELAHDMLALRFVCGDGTTLDISLAGVTPSKSTVDLPGEGGTKSMATYQFTTPASSTACVAEVAVARNGHDFHATGHHFAVYEIKTEELSVSPETLLQGQDILLFGEGFVNAGDEMQVKFTSPLHPTRPAVTASLTFVDTAQYSFTAPDLSSLADVGEATNAVVTITINGQQWIDVGQFVFQSQSGE